MPASERTWATVSPGEDAGDRFTGAALELLIGKLDQMAADARKPLRPRIPWEACHPVWFTGSIPLTAGAGSLFQPNLYGPEVSYWWDLRVLNLTGFTAGTVTVALNAAGGQTIAVATSIGEFTWSAQHLLGPQDSLVFTASGITGTVAVAGQAIEVGAAWLPEYLM